MWTPQWADLFVWLGLIAERRTAELKGSQGLLGPWGLRASGRGFAPMVDWKAGQVAGLELLEDREDRRCGDSGPLSPTSALSPASSPNTQWRFLSGLLHTAASVFPSHTWLEAHCGHSKR